MDQLKDATDKGAKILAGGHKLEDGEYANGNFFEPTVLDGVTKDMDIFYQETFGPVIPLITFEDEEKSLKMQMIQHLDWRLISSQPIFIRWKM